MKSTPLYPFFHALWYVFSLLPLRVHYFLADACFALLYYCVRYRRKVVTRNIEESFPDKTPEERQALVRSFYHYFCDLISETIKLMSISPEEMRRRMTFENVELLKAALREKQNCAVYLGHYGNWEWVSSLQLWLQDVPSKCLQLYHPLENATFDRLMGHARERMGSTNVPVEHSVAHFVRYQRAGIPLVIGFIADQTPMWNNIHYWTPFLNHPKTPIFTGPERLIYKFKMATFFLHITRSSRGHWHGRFIAIPHGATDPKDFALTEQYTRLLENNINESPAFWLWSHNRWKRTYEEWLTMVDPVTQKVYMK